MIDMCDNTKIPDVALAHCAANLPDHYSISNECRADFVDSYTAGRFKERHGDDVGAIVKEI